MILHLLKLEHLLYDLKIGFFQLAGGVVLEANKGLLGDIFELIEKLGVSGIKLLVSLFQLYLCKVYK